MEAIIVCMWAGRDAGITPIIVAVKSENAFEHFKETETWLWVFDPKTMRFERVSNDGEEDEFIRGFLRGAEAALSIFVPRKNEE